MKILIYMEIGSIETLDEILGPAVDSHAVDKYAILTVDGAPLMYEKDQDSAADYLNEMAISCFGVTR